MAGSALALAVVGTGAWLATNHFSNDATGNASSALPPPRPPTYSVLYQTDTSTGGQRSTQWQSLTVDRPFDSASLTYDANPTTGARPASGYVSTDQALYDVDSRGVHMVAGKQPGVPSGDQDLLTQMPEMLARGLASDTGTVGHVAGRSCRVFRLFEPPAGAIAPLAGAGNHDDMCLASDGIVLSQAWTLRSHLVYSERALAVSSRSAPVPPVTGSTSSAPASAPTLVPDPSPRSFLAPPPVPRGFRPSGAYAFTLPAEQDPSLPQASSVVWVFVRGSDVVSVEAGAEAGGVLPWQGENTVAEPATLPSFAGATSAIRSDGAEIRIPAGHGEWVRVRGTVPVNWLERYASGLRLARRAARRTVPRDGLPRDGLPREGLPRDGLPRDGLPRDGLKVMRHDA